MDFASIRDNFIQEARELLEKLETQLLLLENESGDSSVIQEVFRITHTIKGSAAMFGFDKMGALTHHIENIYDSIRNGGLSVNKKIITLTLKSADFLRILLENNEELSSKEKDAYNKLLNEIKKNNIKDSENSDLPSSPDTNSSNSGELNYYFLHYKPDKDIFIRGINPYYFFEDLNELGNYRCDPEIDPDTLKDIESSKEFSGEWKIYLASIKALKDIQGLFLFFNEDEYKIFQINPEDLSDNKAFTKYFSEISQSAPDFEHIKGLISDFKQEYANLNQSEEAKTGIFDQDGVEDEKEEGNKTDQPAGEKQITKKTAESIRVSAHKLDELINLVSELIIINSQLSYLVEEINDVQINKKIGILEKLYKQLRNNALELRLVPLKSITLKFHRLIRDLSNKLNKDVDFVTVGENTELDSNIIAKIESPLMHIIRNSMDHGIEDPEIRMKNGKQPKGIIRLISFYSGANVFIQVQDDGKGIDPEFIRKKAIEKGIINPSDKLTDKELYDIIFLPGFSTAQGLTEVSGRGVGMDVVKRNIQELRGTIEIDSEVGLGTSVSLKLPLTLSIIDTLLVNVNEKAYLVPLNLIESCHKINHTELVGSNNKHIEFNKEILPFIYLREYFEVGGEFPNIENLIILKHNDKKYGLIADKVIGEYQAVVKPLGHIHKNQEYLTGAGILGNGELALILDTNKLISTIKKELIYD